MENESHECASSEYVGPHLSLMEAVGDKESPGTSLLSLQGAGEGRSGRILPAGLEAEERGVLEQITQDKTLPGLSLKGEKDSRDFLYFSTCYKNVGHDWDQRDRQE